MATNKEQVYDDEISPLVAQIIGICKRAGIACFCTFDISSEDDPEFYCTTCLPDENKEFPDAIKDCEKRLYRKPEFLAIAITIIREDGSRGKTH